MSCVSNSYLSLSKDRKIEAFEEIENLNDSVLENADIVSGKILTLEDEKALAQLGIKLQKFNGVAIASNFQGKEKYLQDMGFTKNGGNWSISYEEIPPKIGQKSKEDDMPPAPENPAKVLSEHLKAFGLNKEQIKEFVSDVLGLTSQDAEGIKEVLEDLSLLDKMVTEFMEEAKKPQIINDENTLF